MDWIKGKTYGKREIIEYLESKIVIFCVIKLCISLIVILFFGNKFHFCVFSDVMEDAERGPRMTKSAAFIPSLKHKKNKNNKNEEEEDNNQDNESRNAASEAEAEGGGESCTKQVHDNDNDKKKKKARRH